eukprot:TRINITY_DN4546_c0_g1_i2.p1 TRINITY_DN4546_c0_g1~~TRINITY_DN4546_c0_g1_i2.p1  ORF type:complete len:291 (+),score=89.89 TRINITY_DN4546_c0_g1_i2:430-1302(+)
MVKTAADILMNLQGSNHDKDAMRENLLQVLKTKGGHETLRRIAGLAETMGDDDEDTPKGLELLKGDDDTGYPTLTLNTVSPDTNDRTKRLNGTVFGSFRVKRRGMRSSFSGKNLGSTVNLGSPVLGGTKRNLSINTRGLRVDASGISPPSTARTDTSSSQTDSPKLELPECVNEDNVSVHSRPRSRSLRRVIVEFTAAGTQTDDVAPPEPTVIYSVANLDSETRHLLEQIGVLKGDLTFEKAQSDELRKRLTKECLKKQYLELKAELQEVQESNDRLRALTGQKASVKLT